MKITDIKTFVVDNLWKNCFFEGLYGVEITRSGEATEGLTTKPNLGDVKESV